MSKQKPAHEIRLGRIRATVWANATGDNGTRYNVTLTRLYKDDDDNWRDSNSFGRDDLLAVGKAAELAFFWVHQQKTEPQQTEGEEAK